VDDHSVKRGPRQFWDILDVDACEGAIVTRCRAMSLKIGAPRNTRSCTQKSPILGRHSSVESGKQGRRRTIALQNSMTFGCAAHPKFHKALQNAGHGIAAIARCKRARIRRSRLGYYFPYKLSKSEGTIAATDRRHVRTGHTWVTLVQGALPCSSVFQFLRGFLEEMRERILVVCYSTCRGTISTKIFSR
jgi:hypothetical protein